MYDYMPSPSRTLLRAILPLVAEKLNPIPVELQAKLDSAISLLRQHQAGINGGPLVDGDDHEMQRLQIQQEPMR